MGGSVESLSEELAKVTAKAISIGLRLIVPKCEIIGLSLSARSFLEKTGMSDSFKEPPISIKTLGVWSPGAT